MILLIRSHNNHIEAEKKCPVEEIWKIKESQFFRETHMLKNSLRCQITQMKLLEQQNKNSELSCLIKLIVPDLLRLLKEAHMNLIMERSIMDNGPKKDCEMEKVRKYGKMEVNTVVIGNMIKPTEREGLYMLTEMHMKETGLMIKLKVEVLMNMLMVQNMLVTGKKTDSMVMELKHGQIMQNMKETTNTEKNMVSVLSNGQMAHLT